MSYELRGQAQMRTPIAKSNRLAGLVERHNRRLH